MGSIGILEGIISVITRRENALELINVILKIIECKTHSSIVSIYFNFVNQRIMEI